MISSKEKFASLRSWNCVRCPGLLSEDWIGAVYIRHEGEYSQVVIRIGVHVVIRIVGPRERWRGREVVRQDDIHCEVKEHIFKTQFFPI
jgi:hypothetical protein